jgi:hypothetical protein
MAAAAVAAPATALALVGWGGVVMSAGRGRIVARVRLFRWAAHQE